MSDSTFIDFGREVCGHLDAAERREWLVTNGIGGYACGTVAGILTRRYHGLLMAALDPPLGRTLLVSKLDAEVSYDGHRYDLSANRWADGTLEHPATARLGRFQLEGTIPVWTWALGDALLEQRVLMVPGQNTTLVHYRLARARKPVEIVAKCLANYRGHHGRTRGGDWRMGVSMCPDGVAVEPFEGANRFFARWPGAEVSPHQTWYSDFWLAQEAARGLEPIDDHLDVAHFRVRLNPGESTAAILTVVDGLEIDPDAVLEERRRYERERIATSGMQDESEGVRQLVLAADQFVVRRETPDNPDGSTILAGYPWFGEWGRDAMIALPGLLLATGRHTEAASVLKAWASFVDEGMLPNEFPEKGEDAGYNTADAALWYIEAARAYHAASGDGVLIKTLWPVLVDIVDWYEKGTRYGIGVDPEDGLLRAGQLGWQVTWMDAKVDDWVVTPRIGKPVELNALWYNAVASLAELAGVAGADGKRFAKLARRAKGSFQRFWNDDRTELFDVLDCASGDDPTRRPNQLLAVSLHHSALTAEQQAAVVDECAHRLLTSHGLRSLDPDHPGFVSRYVGDVRERDSAYHQGTVWAWLIGPFVLAHLRVHGDKAAARSYVAPFARHLQDHGLGSVAEVFDGEAPFQPRGCIAQAWSVAEILRACEATR